MSEAWSWEYVPDAEHVISGLPPEAVAEVERIAGSLVVLAHDAVHVGRGKIEGGGLRSLDLAGGRGFLMFMAHPRKQLVIVVRVVWNG